MEIIHLLGIVCIALLIFVWAVVNLRREAKQDMKERLAVSERVELSNILHEMPGQQFRH